MCVFESVLEKEKDRERDYAPIPSRQIRVPILFCFCFFNTINGQQGIMARLFLLYCMRHIAKQRSSDAISLCIEHVKNTHSIMQQLSMCLLADCADI